MLDCSAGAILALIEKHAPRSADPLGPGTLCVGEANMRALEFVRCALCVSVAAALLCACGGGSSIPIASAGLAHSAGAPKGSKTFKYTGSEQTFKVPKGVKQLAVVALGGEGAGLSMYPSTNTPGRPGRVRAIISVRAGEKLYVFVGGSGLHGGFNGGGAGGESGGSGTYQVTGNPGGGASDVRAGGDMLANRVIVAAGGGGAGEAIYDYAYAYGGNGGGLAGEAGGSGSVYPGGGGGAGGTQSAGGSGGAGGIGGFSGNGDGQPGGNGALGLGGIGGNGNQNSFYAAGGGGGGGGYYGGGGGGGSAQVYYSSRFTEEQSGGGGGGSSYIEPSALKSRMWTGWKWKGDGLVVFSWS
jgi:hypothetical protein